MAVATVHCWGSNSFGQLGNSATTSSSVSVPVPVTGLSSPGDPAATAITAGFFHTCALLAGATVRCWGSDFSGHVANIDVTNVSAIAAGDHHTCALLADATVRCWGRNVSGQLGNNNTTNSPVPVPVTGLGTPSDPNVTAIAAGGANTCALLADATLRCWGNNASGQLGNNSTTGSPVPVTGLGTPSDPNVTAITAGLAHTCALLVDATLRCWGLNESGQLGNDTTTNSPVPVSVTGLGTPGDPDVTGITAGDYHTCARLADATVHCWGNNEIGQLGNDTTTSSPVPVLVVELAELVRRQNDGTWKYVIDNPDAAGVLSS